MIFKKYFWLGVFFLLFGGLLFYKLSFFPTPLFDLDESLYVQNGLEMIKNKSFLVPVWQGQVWLDKPPLSPLLLGVVAKFSPLPVEISTRIYTLLLSLTALFLIFRFYQKAAKSIKTAILTTVITAFTPIFLQRAQVVSLDVTLLIGWLGFFLFIKKPFISTLFLFLSVQSKSLLGFYPLAVYFSFVLFQYLTQQIKNKQLIKSVRQIFFQGLVLSLWYIAALIVYQKQFFQAHLIESHFRRVSASLESHFGQRTFYLDLIKEQFGPLFYLSLAGFILSLYRFYKKKLSARTFLWQNALLPWFLFLNLTKTKISWYLYPVIPQFAFYSASLLTLIKPRLLRSCLFVFVFSWLIYQGVFKQNLLKTFYSKEDTHIIAAKTAKISCDSLAVLVPNYTRETFWTLKKMNLTIQTTSWWGEHPSMVYYFGKPLRFFYSVKNWQKQAKDYDCQIINPEDLKLVKKRGRLLKSFDNMLLYH